MDQLAQPLQRPDIAIFENIAQQVAGLAPLVALQAEQDRRLVGEVLIERPDADPGLFGDAGRGETLRALLGQNLSRRVENSRNQRIGARLFRLFS